MDRRVADTRGRVADTRGFTLVELLVALMISSLLVGVIFQLMEGQGRYISIQSAREEVQQNSRAVVELIGSELRTLPAGNGIEMAYADSITLRATRFWGVVCVGTGGGTSVTVRMPRLAGGSFGTNLGTHFVADVSGGDPVNPVWTTEAQVTAIGAPLSNPPASCLLGNETSPPANIEVRTLSLGSSPTNGVDQPVPGDPAYVYELATYRTGPSSTGGEWILRRIGNGNNQPMAGPVTPGEGLQFTYFSGATVVPAPILDAGMRASVDRVMMVVETISRNRQGSQRESKVDTVMISLRNRIP